MRWNLKKRHHIKYRTWVSARSPSSWNFSSLFPLCVLYSPNTYYFPGSRARTSHWGTEVTGCPPALPSEDSLSSLGRAGQAGEQAHQSEQPQITRESSKWGGRGEGLRRVFATGSWKERRVACHRFQNWDKIQTQPQDLGIGGR